MEHGRGEPGRGDQAREEPVHVTTTEARGASRGSPVRAVLIASMLLIVVLFAIVYLTGGVSG